ncbi:heterokaryon incompatibility protein-domain-containing protein [Neurospora tetraspora]|uniref:Heterokaryon incompatibility protein-domain-containing protein n=1 Tax=Neurospora tetraspora TaxID=94610 RepID=A0AAE0J796_9PEZI|nr:heterokaryon incompatibility protein-domain-containing protein [Neurospora tetraspora]
MPPKKNEYIRTIPNDYTKYSPLGRDEIRLLRISKLPHAHPTSPATSTNNTDDHTSLPPVQCELYRVKLSASQRPPFAALSYCWGDLRHTLPITVIFRDAELLQEPAEHDEDPLGWKKLSATSPAPVVVENFNVTTNLHAALHAFRADPSSFEELQFLWTDMLCINQDDLAERSYQVSLMRDIYDGSRVVEVWLGGTGMQGTQGTQAEGQGQPGLDLGSSGLLRPEDDLLTDELMVLVDDAGKAMKEAEEWRERNWEGVMMRLTPERRIWVIQEVVYSKQTFVRHANTRIRWNSMLNLVRIKGRLMAARWSKKMVKDMKYDDDELHVPRLWKEGLKPSAQLDWNPTPGYAMLPLLSPLEVIFQTSAFIATDPRDRLFGILSLIPSTSGAKPYLPDYKKSIAQASCDFTKWHVEVLGSWDVLSLCRPRGQRSFFRDSTLPSWAIDFKKDYGEIPPFALQKYADGSPMFSAGICPQSSSWSPRRSYRVIRNGTGRTQEEEDSNKITLPGCIVARITKVWSLNSSSISWLPHPSLWAKDESPPPPPPKPEPKKPTASTSQGEAPAVKTLLDALRSLKAGLNPTPTSASPSSTAVGNQDQDQDREVDPLRWKSAMASHAARILRELWKTGFKPTITVFIPIITPIPTP